MGNSWNHTIIDADSYCGFGRKTAREHITEIHESRQKHPEYSYDCSAKNCKEKPMFVCAYNYITGRAGRTGSNVRTNCIEHTLKFAEKHGIEPPTKDYFGNSIHQPTPASRNLQSETAAIL